jgi:NAD(P)-dependent dehydrogenase (short-subunit alcohol dehydrogenase family)
MKIFLTGGGGGIGEVIKSKLEENNIEVISPNSKELDLSKDFNFKGLVVDGFIHCAGVNSPKSYLDITREEFYKLFEINTFSFIRLTQQLKFNIGSNIVAIGSLYATKTKEYRTEYTMSKHALYGAVKTLAIEKSKDKIPVNLVSPGFVDTPLTRKNLDKNRIELLDTSIPLGLTTVGDIADFLLYLVTKNKAITGQNIIIDNGYSLIGI